ncbi:MAG: 8-amino-7-oxononanoate synthase [Candidatus Wildermuthbacteria bacterium]|nr:8-amino-7-oxononanoate synthase [Candidatus Wildermuthbacteria bacterium]
MDDILKSIKNVLQFADKKNIYPSIYRIESAPTEPVVSIGQKKVLMFSSNNYLGLANDSRIKDTVIEGVKKYGVGSGGSRLLSGNTDVQEELEEKIASFKDSEAGITFLAGYMANTGGIPALMNIPEISPINILKKIVSLSSPAVIFSDELNHASIVDGVRLSKAKKVIYKHLDLNHLENLLRKDRSKKRKLIITDGVFSMDGDIALLPGLIQLAESYNATLFVDDAHGSGVLGKTGKGTFEYYNLSPNSNTIVMGTFTKAFGGIGGFIVGTKELIRYLRVTARTHVFSAPIPPALVMGLIKAIEIVGDSPALPQQTMENANYLRTELQGLGFNTLHSQTQIIPVLIPDENNCIRLSKLLLERGIFAPSIRWPAVPKHKSRLRVTVMASHTKNHLDEFLQAISESKKLSL